MQFYLFFLNGEKNITTSQSPRSHLSVFCPTNRPKPIVDNSLQYMTKDVNPHIFFYFFKNDKHLAIKIVDDYNSQSIKKKQLVLWCNNWQKIVTKRHIQITHFVKPTVNKAQIYSVFYHIKEKQQVLLQRGWNWRMYLLKRRISGLF